MAKARKEIKQEQQKEWAVVLNQSQVEIILKSLSWIVESLEMYGDDPRDIDQVTRLGQYISGETGVEIVAEVQTDKVKPTKK